MADSLPSRLIYFIHLSISIMFSYESLIKLYFLQSCLVYSGLYIAFVFDSINLRIIAFVKLNYTFYIFNYMFV